MDCACAKCPLVSLHSCSLQAGFQRQTATWVVLNPASMNIQKAPAQAPPPMPLARDSSTLKRARSQCPVTPTPCLVTPALCFPALVLTLVLWPAITDLDPAVGQCLAPPLVRHTALGLSRAVPTPALPWPPSPLL